MYRQNLPFQHRPLRLQLNLHQQIQLRHRLLLRLNLLPL